LSNARLVAEGLQKHSLESYSWIAQGLAMLIHIIFITYSKWPSSLAHVRKTGRPSHNQGAEKGDSAK
jgi:hypothetical protein